MCVCVCVCAFHLYFGDYTHTRTQKHPSKTVIFVYLSVCVCVCVCVRVTSCILVIQRRMCDLKIGLLSKSNAIPIYWQDASHTALWKATENEMSHCHSKDFLNVQVQITLKFEIPLKANRNQLEYSTKIKTHGWRTMYLLTNVFVPSRKTKGETVDKTRNISTVP